jgi:hypothetical protein
MNITTTRVEEQTPATITRMTSGAHHVHRCDLDAGNVDGLGAYLPGTVTVKNVNGHAWIEVAHNGVGGARTSSYVTLDCSVEELLVAAAKAVK